MSSNILQEISKSRFDINPVNTARMDDATKFEVKQFGIGLFNQLKTLGLIHLFLIGFLLSAGFVSLYNYIGFQLITLPYSLSQTLVGFIFIVYIVGTFSSTWMGMLADQYGWEC
ncbi:Inner membrane transport protein YnfM [Peribacillus sp. Bi96]|uniref:hypothetical protein n=1 Tax=Peribacillus sp. Bi96 TaxID=2884273 RepID=UPI001DF10DFF|nr:Inner membrane transport protein YnfM [Peribacillus sp. Bi96]